MLENFDDVLTVEELCEALRIGRNSAYAMLAEGKIQAFRVGVKWRIPKTAAIDFLTHAANSASQDPFLTKSKKNLFKGKAG